MMYKIDFVTLKEIKPHLQTQIKQKPQTDLITSHMTHKINCK